MRVGLLGGRYRSYTIAEKLAARTVKQPNGCWEVQGSRLHSGHVQIASGSPAAGTFVRVRAHVFAWEQANNQTVPRSHVVMHTCDNPPCVNPAHLQLGLQRDNVADAVAKGRFTLWHQTGFRLDGRPTKRRLHEQRAYGHMTETAELPFYASAVDSSTEKAEL